jgi:putative lipoprotein
VTRGLLVAWLLLGPTDRWFGVDKLKHFVVSALAQSVAHGALQWAGARPTPALLGSLGAGVALGVGREVHDRRTKGAFSRRDLVWDAAGLAAATALARHTER